MPTAIGARGCRFVLDDQHQCGVPPRRSSSYCEEHHALCYIAAGSAADKKRLREVAKIGAMVGGRGGFAAGPMTDKFVRRLESVQRR